MLIMHWKRQKGLWQRASSIIYSFYPLAHFRLSLPLARTPPNPCRPSLPPTFAYDQMQRSLAEIDRLAEEQLEGGKRRGRKWRKKLTREEQDLVRFIFILLPSCDVFRG